MALLVALVAAQAGACSMGGTENDREGWFTRVILFSGGTVLVSVAFALVGLAHAALIARRPGLAVLNVFLAATHLGIWMPAGEGMDCGSLALERAPAALLICALALVASFDGFPRRPLRVASVSFLWGVFVLTCLARDAFVYEGGLASWSSDPLGLATHLKYLMLDDWSSLAVLAAVSLHWAFLRSTGRGVLQAISGLAHSAGWRTWLHAAFATTTVLSWALVGLAVLGSLLLVGRDHIPLREAGRLYGHLLTGHPTLPFGE